MEDVVGHSSTSTTGISHSSVGSDCCWKASWSSLSSTENELSNMIDKWHKINLYAPSQRHCLHIAAMLKLKNAFFRYKEREREIEKESRWQDCATDCK